MIIWINGCYGSGKTQTAKELHRRLSGSVIYDFEKSNSYFRKAISADTLRLFSPDAQLGRKIIFELLKQADTINIDYIIVPLTLYNKEYFDEIIGNLRRNKIQVYHYIMGVDKEIQIKRLKERFQNENCWAAKQFDVCIKGFNEIGNEGYINTNEIDIDTVVEIIAQNSELKLKNNRRNKIKKIVNKRILRKKHLIYKIKDIVREMYKNVKKEKRHITGQFTLRPRRRFYSIPDEGVCDRYLQ